MASQRSVTALQRFVTIGRRASEGPARPLFSHLLAERGWPEPRMH